MKHIISILSAFLLMALVSSCEKYVEGYDISPNEPLTANLDILLTGIEVSTINSYTGNLARLPGLFANQLAGRQFQFEEYEVYSLDESDIDNEWNQLYNRGLINSQQLIDQAGDNNRIYRGMGRVLKAMNIGLATDLWGDVPYTQALKGLSGEEAFNPAYDAQENILRDIQSTLEAAIQDLASDPDNLDENLRFPAGDDLFFGGDPEKWANVARILQARYLNRLSERDPQASATQILAILDEAYANGLDGTDDDMMAPHGEAVPEWNQWYAFEQNREGYMVVDPEFVELLVSLNDPRLPLYVTTFIDSMGNEVYLEQPIGPRFNAPSAPLPLVTFFEAKFIEAEAALRAGDAGRAATAFNQALEANLQHLGFDTEMGPGAAYLAANAAGGSVTLEQIMTQKYLAMFTQPEVWADWRRTGLPELTPNTGAEIPRRLPTSQNERLYNTNAVVVFDLFQRVWWDMP
jgi:hypothetical protein